MNYISSSEVDRFNEEGYLIFEGLFDRGLNERIKADVDQLMNDRQKGKQQILMTYPELGLLTSEPSVVDRVADLMQGKKFTHHHIHARWQTSGERGVAWHHDYVQTPQANRSHLMVHVFMYMDGLNGEIGDLLVMPGTHKKVMNNNAFQQFQFEDLPGSRAIDDLAPGSIIIIHSAVQHARRPKTGGDVYKRYFIDTSYCQEGIIWGGYSNIQNINRIALENGYDREGKYDFLYDTSKFFDRQDLIQRFKRVNKGSLILHVS